MSSTSPLQRLPMRLTRADGVRLVASLILAILLWGLVTNAQDPEMSRTFSSVPIKVGELPSPLQVVVDVPDASVTVTGPRSVISDMSASDVTASLDLDGIDEPGDVTVSIDAGTPRGVWDVSVNPTRLPIRVEESVTELFVVQTEITGNLDATRQVNATVADTSELTVVGPRSSVDRVARVIVPIQIENQTRDFTTSVAPQAVDEQGKPIPEVSISPDTVTVNVSIDARGKRVAVLTQLEGSPAQGYEVVDRTINPATVLVDGPDALVDSLISVSTEPIDISGASATLTRRVEIVGLPEGVNVIDPSDQAVDVVIQIRQLGVRQPLPAQTITIIGLGEGLAIEVSPDAVAVTVVAPESMLGSLTTSDLAVQVNVTGLGPGTYSLEPVVALPPGVTWVSSDPGSVTVHIREADGTPVPEPESTPVPAA
jgi:YbbR domain-containing protein